MEKGISIIHISSFLLLFHLVASAQSKSTSKNLAATPVIIKEDGLGNKTVENWSQPTAICKSCKNVWTNKDGSKIWFEKIESGNFNKALTAFGKKNTLNNLQVIAKEPLKKAYLLDKEGYGWTIIARASKNSQNYKLAAILLYGSLDESPKTTGVHAYLAKEKNFVSSGGWVVPASFWLGINPIKDVGDLLKQGTKEPKKQAKIFGELSDIWIESIYQAYVLQMQANVKSLHNLRISAIAAWDSNAIVVPGDNGYNEIEYKID
jgi:hypothetical protein